jgi:hypothetical protein
MSFAQNTQLTLATGYNTNNMVFEKPRDGTIPNSTFTFKRVPIGTKNPDGTTGELVILTPRVYSFGLSVNTNMQTGKPDGYTFPLCLQSRDGLTPDEKAFIDTFNNVVERCKQYILDNKDELGKYDIEMGDLKKLNSLYYKRDKGKVVEGTGPVLYPKVLQQKKKSNGKGGKNSVNVSPEEEAAGGKITTIFCDENGVDIDPLSLLEKHCFATAAVKIESIFVGAKISLQVKVHEAEVSVIGGTSKRLLKRPQGSSQVVMHDSPAPTTTTTTTNHASTPAVASKHDDDGDDDDDDGSVKGSDSEPDEPAPKPVVAPTKAPARRVAAKK